MIIVDLNVLLYAINGNAVHHARVRAWWEAALSSDETIGLAWVVLLGFLRLSTNPRAFPNPLSIEEALERARNWLGHPNTRMVGELDTHWEILQELLSDVGTGGNLTTDAHLAALAISHAATLASCDADFGRFLKLRWLNPIAP